MRSERQIDERLRALLLANSAADCDDCHGTGVRPRSGACQCALRAMFKACWLKFKTVAAGGHLLPPISPGQKGGTRRVWRLQELSADFVLIARRVLTPSEYRLFSAHYLLGADWRLCASRMGLRSDNAGRKRFFDECYRIEAKLGFAYLTTRPYALFPIRDYLIRVPHGVRVEPCPVSAPRLNGVPVRPPLAPHPAAREPEPSILEPARVPPFDIHDATAAHNYIRHAFLSGRCMLPTIMINLNAWGVPAPNGGTWVLRDVRSILMRKVA